jgi:uncharacterized protein involved in outer membrane biogenesis
MNSTLIDGPRPQGPALASSRPLRWSLGIAAALALAVTLFLALFNWDLARPALAQLLAAHLHRPVRIGGHLRVHLLSWTPSARVEGLKVGGPAWAPSPDMADIAALSVQVKLAPLVLGRVVLPRIEVEKPDLVLVRDKQGRASWDFSDGRAPEQPIRLPPIQSLIINDGQLNLTDQSRGLSFSGKIFAHEQSAGASASGFGMTGIGRLNGEPFTMNVTGGSLLNVRSDRAYPFNAIVSAGATRVTAKGSILHPFNLAQITAQISVQGRSMSDLYPLTGLALPDTPPFAVAGDYRRDNRVTWFDGFTGRVGGSDLEGDLKVDSSKSRRPFVTTEIRSRRLDFKDLGSLFGATSRNQPSGMRLAITAAKDPGRRLMPDQPLDVQRIRGMDGVLHYKALSVQAAPDLPLRQVSLGVKLDHGLLTIDPVELTFPVGRLSGRAVIDARAAVQTDMIDFRLTGVQMQDFVSHTSGPPPLEGVLDARAKLQGVGDSVHKAAASSDGQITLVIPHGVIRQAFAELLGIDATKGLFMLLAKNNHQTDVRCAVADFRVRDGLVQAQQILFDTGVVQVLGKGDINLKTEAINLSFSGKPKQFRLIRINAPITVTGQLTSPAFGVNIAGAAGQVGVGVALAAFATPLAAVLPFVEPGLAHDSNCAGLIASARTGPAPVAVAVARGR